MSESINVLSEERQEYPKIGGWLILAGFAIVLNPILHVLIIFRDFVPIFFGKNWSILTTPGTTYYHPVWSSHIILGLLGNIALIVFSIFIALFFFQRKKVLPKMIIAFYIFQLLFVVLDNVLSNMIPKSCTILPCYDLTSMLIGTSIWVSYFLISKRVKRTFVC